MDHFKVSIVCGVGALAIVGWLMPALQVDLLWQLIAALTIALGVLLGMFQTYVRVLVPMRLADKAFQVLGE